MIAPVSMRFLGLYATLLIAVNGCTPQHLECAEEWQTLGPEKERAVSGLASDGASGFFVVHDNKDDDQVRIARIDHGSGGAEVNYRPLRWIGTALPSDLEAITRETSERFLAVTNRGLLFRLTVGPEAVSATALARLPGTSDESEVEAFDLWAVAGRPCAVWAERGDDARPAILSWGWFDAERGRVERFQSARVRLPSLGKNTRHISDLRVATDGALLVASAADPGNDGPFRSAVWIAGQLRVENGEVLFSAAPRPRRLCGVTGHKIEGIDFIPGTRRLALAADDENQGGAICVEPGK